VTTRCEANVVWELATQLMLATSPDSAVGVAARAAHLAAIEAERVCACAAHPAGEAAPVDARDLHQRRYAELRAAKAARVEAHGDACFGVCCLGQSKAAR